MPSPPSTRQRSTSSGSSRRTGHRRSPHAGRPGSGFALDDDELAAGAGGRRRGGEDRGVGVARPRVREDGDAPHPDSRPPRSPPSRSPTARPPGASQTKSPGCPSARAAPTTRSRVAARPSSRGGCDTFAHRLAAIVAGAHDAPLPTLPRPTSNCGLTIASTSPHRRSRRAIGRQHLRQRDEGDVDDDQVGPERQLGGSSARALTRSITVTRAIVAQRQSSWP